MMYKQGDIVVVKFPFTDLSSFKPRPAIILSNSANNKQGDYLIVQVTSKSSFDTALEIRSEDYSGKPLALQSFVRCNKIFCLSESLIAKKAGRVNVAFSRKINKKVLAIIKR